jgi:glycosyltransferase involved in cell wall biosynthesis
MSHKVSIIMPVLNGQKYIGEALGSIAAQTFKDYELIVVNDGSTDGTCDQLSPFIGRIDLRCIHHATPHGIARSINDGIRDASGEFIAFLDHDDLWFPDFLETQITHMQQHPDVGMVHSDFQTVDSEGNILEASVAVCRNRRRVSGSVFPELFMDSFIVGNSVLIRKECFDRLGTFDETLRIGDYHMWMRIARHYRVDYTPKVLTKYRQHQTQDSGTFAAEEQPPGLMAIKSILELYPEVCQELGARTIRRRMASLYGDVAYSLFSKGVGKTTRTFLTKAIRLQPANLRYYGLYAGSFLQPSQAQIARRIWHALQRSPNPFRPSTTR